MAQMQLTPPELFGIVEEGVYRSNMVQPINEPFLRTLNLKHILFLSQEHIPKATVAMIEDMGVSIRYLPHHAANNHPYASPLSEDSVKEALEFILTPQNYPVMMMCPAGIQESGVIVGCLRKLEHWNFNAISCEYRSYAGSKGRTMVEHFINLFDLDLINLPSTLPKWYAYQLHVARLEKQELAQRIKDETQSQPSTAIPS